MLSTEMQIIECDGFGDPGVMKASMRPIPVPQSDEVLIRVAAAGVNRADTMQRKGQYPPPQGVSDVLGLEVAGTVVAVGGNARRWKIGDRICALLGGGGYSEYATAPETHCLPLPESLGLIEAAALPEAVVTVFANLFESAELKAGETLLIHGGSSGIGTTAIQMAKLHGARVYVTAGSVKKCAACIALGADLAIDYTSQDYVDAINLATGGHGVDVVLDMIGGSYIERNLSIMATGGRHISIATQSGAKAEIDLRQIIQKRLIITGSTLRGRGKDEKARLISRIGHEIWPWVMAGKLKPLIFQAFPLKNAAEAHKMMESGSHIGKMVLEVS